MINSRFSIQVHIVSLLATSEEAITSEYIAGSVNCNPVLIRKELSVLKKAGIVITQEGKNGGVHLGKDPKKIFLDELFKIVYEGADIFSPNKNTPNPACQVGKNINGVIAQINQDAEKSLVRELHRTSIADILKSIHA